MVGEGALERQSVHGKDEGNTLCPAGGRGVIYSDNGDDGKGEDEGITLILSAGSPLLVLNILKVVMIEKGCYKFSYKNNENDGHKQKTLKWHSYICMSAKNLGKMT